MFTGLIEEMGTVKSVKRRAGSMELTISGKKVTEDLPSVRSNPTPKGTDAAPLVRISNGVKKGDSISVNGVCLTVTSYELRVTSFKVDVSPETLKKTNLGELKTGEKVNLEKALKIGDRLGGHFVTGHIDGVGIIKKRIKEGSTFLFEIEAPDEIMNYIIPKGSIAVDGISLTIVNFSKDRFSVSVIPHTLEVTTLGFKRVGDKVNLEADMIGKYVVKLIKEKKGIDLDFLKRYGF